MKALNKAHLNTLTRTEMALLQKDPASQVLPLVNKNLRTILRLSAKQRLKELKNCMIKLSKKRT